MQLTLIEKTYLIDNIWIFRFEPESPLVWTAGQYVRVELPHENPDEEGTKRWFTNSAAPYEGVMQISTRITGSTFKQALSHLEPGDTLRLIENPEGDFVWQDSDLPKIFVAAGIGITPYHSILKQRAHDGLPLDVTLIYGLRTKEVPFEKEFDQWVAQDTNLEIKYVIGEPLTVSKLVELEPNLNSSLVYVSGPEQMVNKLGEELKANGLPENQFKHDGFPHYDEQSY